MRPFPLGPGSFVPSEWEVGSDARGDRSRSPHRRTRHGKEAGPRVGHREAGKPEAQSLAAKCSLEQLRQVQGIKVEIIHVLRCSIALFMCERCVFILCVLSEVYLLYVGDVSFVCDVCCMCCVRYM